MAEFSPVDAHPPSHSNYGSRPPPQHGNGLGGPEPFDSSYHHPQQPHQQQQQGGPGYQSSHMKPQAPTGQKFVRTISSTDPDKVQICKDQINRDYTTSAPPGGLNFFAMTPSYTLVIPTLDMYDPSPAFKQFLLDKIVAKSVQTHLEQENVLNWCNTATKLYPLTTQPDGNCLLHAASLAMWGFQDQEFVFREAIHTALGYNNGNTLYERWKYNRQLENEQIHVQYDPHQWEEEWGIVVKEALPTARAGNILESLDEFHIFILANVIRRPIVVYASSKLRSLRGGGTLQEVNIQGVYLPLLWDPSVCKKAPLPLAYHGGHFSALAIVEPGARSKDDYHVFPMVDYYGKQLPIKFMLPVEKDTALVMDYLLPLQIPSNQSSPYITTTHIICARVPLVENPPYLTDLLSGFIVSCLESYRQSAGHFGDPQGAGGGEGGDWQDRRGSEERGEERGKCINNCGRYGDPQFSYMCPECYQKVQREHQYGKGDGGGQRSPIRTHSQEQQQQQQGGYGRGNAPPDSHRRESQEGASKCINNCGRYGDVNYAYMCSVCYEKAQTDPQYGGRGGDRPAQNNSHEHQQGGYRRSSQSGGGGGGGGAAVGTVKCAHCSEPGIPQLLGMCQRCYNLNSTHPPPADPAQDRPPNDPIYESLPNDLSAPSAFGPPGGEDDQPPALPFPRNPKDRSTCRTPGCKFYGTKEHRYYCSKCFETNMEAILKEADDNLPLVPPGSLSPTEPESYIPPVSSRGQQPGGKKCRQCNNYYVNPEYGDQCTKCFMQSTMPGNQSSSHGGRGSGSESGGHGPPETGHRMYTEPQRWQQQDDRFGDAPPNERFNSRAQTMHQQANPQHSSHQWHDDRGPAPHHESPYQDQHSGDHYGNQGFHDRQPQNLGNVTAPIVGLSSQMAGMNVSSDCFLCTGGQVGGNSSHYSICAKHAAAMSQMLVKEKGDFDRGNEVRSKRPAGGGGGGGDHYDPMYQSRERGSDPELRGRGYGRDDPMYQSRERGSDPELRGRGYGGGGGYDERPMLPGRGSEEGMYQRHGSGSGDRRSPVPPSGYNPRRGDDFYERGNTGGGSQKGLYERPRDQGYGNEQQYSKSRHVYDRPQEKLGNEQDYSGNNRGYHLQDQFGNEQDRSPREKFGNEPGYHMDQQQGRFGNERPYHRDDPYGNEQPYYGDDPSHQGRPGHLQDQQAGSAAMGGAGGGATGGAEGGAVGGASGGPTDEFPKMKSLCATTGCSYKGYKDLKDLCPDCYRDNYEPDFNNSREFPLI